MKEILTSHSTVDDLPGVILLSHGEMAAGMFQAATMICGEQENVAVLCLEPADGLEEYRARLIELFDLFPNGAIVLCDMLGGSPFNSLAAVSENRKLYGLAGANLPVLLEILMSRSFMTLQELSDMAAAVAKDNVVSLSEYQSSLT